MCHLRNISMRDYQESVTTDTRTDGQTDTAQRDPYVSLCFAGDTKMNVSEYTMTWCEKEFLEREKIRFSHCEGHTLSRGQYVGL